MNTKWGFGYFFAISEFHLILCARMKWRMCLRALLWKEEEVKDVYHYLSCPYHTMHSYNDSILFNSFYCFTVVMMQPS